MVYYRSRTSYFSQYWEISHFSFHLCSSLHYSLPPSTPPPPLSFSLSLSIVVIGRTLGKLEKKAFVVFFTLSPNLSEVWSIQIHKKTYKQRINSKLMSNELNRGALKYMRFQTLLFGWHISAFILLPAIIYVSNLLALLIYTQMSSNLANFLSGWKNWVKKRVPSW